MYRTSDPYAEVCDDINAEKLRAMFVTQRTAALHTAMRRPFTSYVEPGDWTYSIDNRPVAVAIDFGGWLESQGADAIARCTFDPAMRADTIDQYIAARVRAEADARDWRQESLDDLAWQSAGCV